MKNSDNKQIVLGFYKNVIGKKDIAFAKKTLTDNYIQHNPMIKTGKAGLIEAIEMLKQIPTPKNPPRPFMRLIAEGDLVAVHMMVEFGGFKKIVFDLFRLENGLISEHWDAIQDVTALGPNAYQMIDGPIPIEKASECSQNKSVVEAWCQQVLINKEYNMIWTLGSTQMIWHSQQAINGKLDIPNELKRIKIEKIHRIIAEGNFVMSQSNGMTNGIPHVFYDIYRLTDGKIQEYWSVSQAIPQVMAHENGMI